jgi:hypothetical protein
MSYNINILSANACRDINTVTDIYKLLEKEIPHLSITKYGNHEPLKSQEVPISDWIKQSQKPEDFFWKSNFSRGSFWTNSSNTIGNTHAEVTMEIAEQEASSQELIKFTRGTARLAAADFGFIDVYTDEMNQFALDSGLGGNGCYFLTTHTLRNCLPMTFWANFFGRPYIELFGKEKLLQVPAHSIELISDDLIYIQLTENLSDIKNLPNEVNLARQRAQDFLGKEYFFTSDLEKSEVKAVAPLFSLDS